LNKVDANVSTVVFEVVGQLKPDEGDRSVHPLLAGHWRVRVNVDTTMPCDVTNSSSSSSFAGDRPATGVKSVSEFIDWDDI